MRVNSSIFMAILASALVTWIPRILPFLLVKYKGLPAPVTRFLKIPAHFHYLCLGFIKLSRWKNWKPPAVSLVGSSSDHSSLFVAFRYKNLMGTVLFGIVLIALLRLVF